MNVKNITLTKHVKQRAIERLGVSDGNVEKYLRDLLMNVEEVYNSGQGRAFENKKYGVVMIMDDSLNQMVTLYTTKGTLINEENRLKSSESLNKGIVKDEKIREVIWKEFKKRIVELEKECLNIDIELSKFELKLSKSKRAIYLQNDLEKAFELKEKHDILLDGVKEIRKMRDESNKNKGLLIDSVENSLGIHLNEYQSLFRKLK